MNTPSNVNSSEKPNILCRTYRSLQRRWNNRNIRYSPYPTDQLEQDRITSAFHQRTEDQLVSSPGRMDIGCFGAQTES